MDCPICRDLMRAYETERSEYIEARSSVMYSVSTKLAAYKNVEMQRARNELQEHRLACASAGRIIAFLPGRALSASLNELAA